MPVFPPELLDIIVNDLHGDIYSLKACSLAARVFVPSTRIHIFSTVYLLPPTESTASQLVSVAQRNHCQKFDMLLDRSPHLAPLVKDLRIVEGLSVRGRDREANMGRNAGVPENILWDQLPRRLTTAIHDVLRSPAIESVRLLGFNVEHPSPFIAMLCGAERLKELALDYANGPPSTPVTVPPNWRPQLQHLAFSDYFTHEKLAPAFSSSNIDFSRLKTLSLHGLSDANAIRSLLELLSQNNILETLDISYRIYPIPAIHEDLGLTSFPCLRSVRFSGRLSITDLASILTQCAAHTSLEGIIFEASAKHLRGEDANNWQDFYAAFQNLSPGTTVTLLLFQSEFIWEHNSRPRSILRDRMDLMTYRAALEQRGGDIGLLLAQGILSLQEECACSTLREDTEPYLRLR
ncbi:hypothetical protein DFH07DRAFT_964430 [Mycena maculata]|uniref:Uncharacterized protein n=1 Tax=Mycena maculata TaxID=230809 RepID=A0AAD7N2D2_9AGAR|nr:hypothetical protein DFH07DRAFT_964430 [Mycena maculata]